MTKAKIKQTHELLPGAVNTVLWFLGLAWDTQVVGRHQEAQFRRKENFRSIPKNIPKT